MKKVLGPEFFNRPTLVVAKDLIGKYLCRRVKRGRHATTVALMIVETEAYDGPNDLACHARSGKTGRNWPMFGPPGYAYVYFTYGMHWMLNLVTGAEEYPAAVLIRGVETVSGPARLTKFLQIDKNLNTKKLARASGLWVEDRGVVVKKSEIKRGPRVGVDYAGLWAKKPWRFILLPSSGSPARTGRFSRRGAKGGSKLRPR